MNEARAEPQWVTLEIALAIHDRQIAEHGGAIGIRDASLLESALSRPVNQWAYGVTDKAALAAAYAFGIARNHPFTDGNKRTAWVAARLFLALNTVELAFDKIDATQTMLALAAGEIDEHAMSLWFSKHIIGR